MREYNELARIADEIANGTRSIYPLEIIKRNGTDVIIRFIGFEVLNGFYDFERLNNEKKYISKGQVVNLLLNYETPVYYTPLGGLQV